MSLPDYLLTDIGLMYRSGNEVKVEEVRQLDAIQGVALMSDKNEVGRCVVLSVDSSAHSLPARLPADDANRAA